MHPRAFANICFDQLLINHHLMNGAFEWLSIFLTTDNTEVELCNGTKIPTCCSMENGDVSE